MEKEKIRFLSVWLSHSMRSSRLPYTVFRDVAEGKISGLPPLHGIKISENHIINVELPETEQTLVALSGTLVLFHRYISSNYDDIISREKLLRPAKEFLEKNKERVEALRLGSYIPPVLGDLPGAPSPDERKTAIISRATHIPSGVAGFDTLINGGIPRNTSVLLQAPTGNEPELFADQFIRQSLEDKAPVLVIVAGQSPADLRKSLRALGASPEEAETTGQMRIIDWYSQRFERVNGIEEAGSVSRVSKDLTNVGIAINKAVRTMPDSGPRRAVVKLLTQALTEFPFEQVYSFAESTKAKFKNNAITALFLIDKGSHNPQVLSSLQKVFDGVIDIEKRRVEVRMISELSVLSMAGATVRGEYLPCTIDADGKLKLEPMAQPAPAAKWQGPEQSGSSIQPAPSEHHPPSPTTPHQTTSGPIPARPEHRTPPGQVRQSPEARSPAAAAQQLARMGKRADAVKAYDDVLSRDPGNFEALNGKAIIFQLQGNHREALKCYDDAIASNPSDAETWSNRGISLRTLGRTEEAIQSYDRAIQINPKDAGVWSNRGIALRSLGRTDEAVESYDEALKMNPRDAGVWSNRGVALTSVSRYEEALESFDRALEADPNYEKARKNRQVLLEKIGK